MLGGLLGDFLPSIREKREECGEPHDKKKGKKLDRSNTPHAKKVDDSSIINNVNNSFDMTEISKLGLVIWAFRVVLEAPFLLSSKVFQSALKDNCLCACSTDPRSQTRRKKALLGQGGRANAISWRPEQYNLWMKFLG
jgi:hypothetical protein